MSWWGSLCAYAESSAAVGCRVDVVVGLGGEGEGDAQEEAAGVALAMRTACCFYDDGPCAGGEEEEEEERGVARGVEHGGQKG